MNKLLLLIFLLVSCISSAQEWTHNQKIVSEERIQSANFGKALALNDNFAAIGAPGDEKSVYIFKKDETLGWIFNQKVSASDGSGETYSEFGIDVHINDNWLIVGDWGETKDTNQENPMSFAGAAYIFKRNSNDEWSEVQKLVASDRSPNSHFGSQVFINDEFIFVSAINDDFDDAGINEISNSGAVYAYRLSSESIWIEDQKIVADSREKNANFGYALDFNDGELFISAPFESEKGDGSDASDNSGAVYCYSFNSELWETKQKILPSPRKFSGNFGFSLAIDQSLVIGAKAESAVYTFEQVETGNWTQVQRLSPPKNNFTYSFGFSLDINDDKLVVGSQQDALDSQGFTTDSQTGAAFTFQLNSSKEWQLSGILHSFSPTAFDNFGYSVGINNNQVIIGCPGESLDENESNKIGSTGAAYSFNFVSNILNVQRINEFNIYPNPTISDFTIDLNQLYKNVNIRIHDYTGHEVFNVYQPSAQVIPITIVVKKGIYFVTIESNDIQVGRQKIVKM